MKPSVLLPVWDIWIRLFHWSLAGSVLLLIYSGLTGELFFEWHRTLGEFVLMLILFRLIWGVVGSSNIRLSRLVKSPVDALHHLRLLVKRNVHPEREHNAAGSLAVLAMLLLLLIQALTGMFIADEDEFVEGAFYGTLDGSITDRIYQVHMITAELIQIIVIVHVLMIAVYFFIGRLNLLTPMFTGRQRWSTETSPENVNFQHWMVGLVVMVACVAVIGWLSGWFA